MVRDLARRRAFLVALLLALVTTNYLCPVRLNLSTSMPQGLYLEKSGSEARPGDIVEACLSSSWSCFGRRRGYLGAGGPCACNARPVVKEVVAAAGDLVSVADQAFQVGSKNFRAPRYDRDRAGRPLPRLPAGRYEVPPGQVWLYGSTNLRSWDSRYFGPIPSRQVISTVQPIWTWSNR